MQLKKARTALIIMAVMLFVACGYSRPADAVAQQTAPVGAELPSIAEGDDIVRHIGYTASYNHTTLCPDWVAWELTADEANGELNGDFSFSRDPQVDFPKASREDYSRSGWDKGHMAPRADMRWSRQALEESYYFTNICPQDHEMNSQAWRKIEELTRRMARHHGTVLVVCGPIYDGEEQRHIGPACVHVPDPAAVRRERRQHRGAGLGQPRQGHRPLPHPARGGRADLRLAILEQINDK